MKTILIVLVWLMFFLRTGQDSRLNLFCSTWKQIGLKSFREKYKLVDISMAEIISFKRNGSFTESLYGNLEIKGQWKFNIDSSKFAFTITEMNSQSVKDGFSISDAIPNDSIIKLNSDTLIYDELKYYGKEKIYGHDDLYFVKEK